MPISPFLAQKGITWVTPADLMVDTYSGTGARLYAPDDTNDYIEFSDANGIWVALRLSLPNQLGGLAVKITDLVIYYRTTTTGAYIDVVQVRKVNPADGTFTAALNYTTDLGNGSTGNANAALLAAPLSLDAGYPYHIAIKQAGAAAWGQVRVYGMRLVWEAT